MKVSKHLFILIFVLLWIGIIFSFSLHSGGVSHTQSNTAKNAIKAIMIDTHFPIDRKLYNTFRPLALPGETVNGEFIIRKMAHGFEYCILGILISLSFVSRKRGEKNENYRHLVSYMITGPIIALIDEKFIQKYLVVQRTSSYKDVILDSFLFLVGFAVLLLFNEIFDHRIRKSMPI